jgi:hypothetical protein
MAGIVVCRSDVSRELFDDEGSIVMARLVPAVIGAANG